MMNGQIFNGATFHALFAIALADRALEIVVPLKGVGQLGGSTIPVWMVLAAYVLTVTLVLAGAATKAGYLKLGRRDPESLATNLTRAILAPLTLFLAAWFTASRLWATWARNEKRFAANLTKATLGIVFFGNTAGPGAKATTTLVLSGREFKGLAAPAAVNGKAGAMSNTGTFITAILPCASPGSGGIVPKLFSAGLASSRYPGGAVRFLERSLGAFLTAILSFVALGKRKLKLRATLLAIHTDHRRHFTFTCNSIWCQYSIP